MAENNYDRTTKLQMTIAAEQNKAYLESVYFTAPFKVMQPIYPYEGYLQIILLAASAGLMAGDTQELNIHISPGCKAELTSQTYEKIHKMAEGYAARTAEVYVGHNSFFRYNPLPTIPFAASAFRNQLNIFLEDTTSKLMLCDILSCGRYASGERFQYRYYKSLTNVYCNSSLVYRDNTYFGPGTCPMDGIGFYEGYQVLANITLFNIPLSQDMLQHIQNYLLETPSVTGGITTLDQNGYLIKILANQAQTLETINEYLFQYIRSNPGLI